MKTIVCIGVWLLAVCWVQARPLTLDECRRLAREHYPAVRQYDLIGHTRDYTLANAGKAWLPQVSLSAQATWQNEVMAFPEALTHMLAQQGTPPAGMRKEQYKVALEVSQTLWDGGHSRAERQIARAEAVEQERAVDVELYAVEERVNNLFFGILLLEAQREQMLLTRALLQSNLDKVRALRRNGVAMQSDVNAVEAEWLAVGQRLAQVEASANSFRRMLGLFIGCAPEEVEPARPPMAEVSDAWESARPEWAFFDASVGKLAAQEQAVRSSTRPRLGLFVQGYYGYPGLNMFDNMLSRDASWNTLAGVRLAWNFGAYYTKKNTLGKLRTAQRQVEVQRDVFRFNTALKQVEESGEITRLRQVLADDERIVTLRRSVREAAESQLRNGVIDTDGLLRKITEEALASQTRAAREIELLKAVYELKHTLNR